MAGLGPSLAQAGYFLNRAPEAVPHAVDRFVDESERLYGVVERQLANSEYLAGDYSIADMACYPWLRNHRRFSVDIADYPNVGRWLETVSARPAVQRGVESP
jgi:GST-like protein